MYVKLSRSRPFGSDPNNSRDWRANISWRPHYIGKDPKTYQTYPEIKHKCIFVRLCMLN